MKAELKQCYQTELAAAREAEGLRELSKAFTHLDILWRTLGPTCVCFGLVGILGVPVRSLGN